MYFKIENSLWKPIILLNKINLQVKEKNVLNHTSNNIFYVNMQLKLLKFFNKESFPFGSLACPTYISHLFTILSS